MKNQNTVPEPLNRNHTTSPRRSQHGCALPKLYRSFTDFRGGLPKPYQNFTGWEKTIHFPSFSHPKMGGGVYDYSVSIKTEKLDTRAPRAGARGVRRSRKSRRRWTEHAGSVRVNLDFWTWIQVQFLDLQH